MRQKTPKHAEKQNSAPGNAQFSVAQASRLTPGSHEEVQRAELHVGPIPHPDTVEKYERIVPGAGAQLFRMAEEEGRVRRENDSKRTDAEVEALRSFGREIRLGQILGFIIILGFLFAGTLCILKGHDAAGAVLAGTGLASVLAVFLYRRGRPSDVLDLSGVTDEPSEDSDR